METEPWLKEGLSDATMASLAASQPKSSEQSIDTTTSNEALPTNSPEKSQGTLWLRELQSSYLVGTEAESKSVTLLVEQLQQHLAESSELASILALVLTSSDPGVFDATEVQNDELKAIYDGSTSGEANPGDTQTSDSASDGSQTELVTIPKTTEQLSAFVARFASRQWVLDFLQASNTNPGYFEDMFALNAFLEFESADSALINLAYYILVTTSEAELGLDQLTDSQLDKFKERYAHLKGMQLGVIPEPLAEDSEAIIIPLTPSQLTLLQAQSSRAWLTAYIEFQFSIYHYIGTLDLLWLKNLMLEDGLQSNWKFALANAISQVASPNYISLESFSDQQLDEYQELYVMYKLNKFFQVYVDYIAANSMQEEQPANEVAEPEQSQATGETESEPGTDQPTTESQTEPSSGQQTIEPEPNSGQEEVTNPNPEPVQEPEAEPEEEEQASPEVQSSPTSDRPKISELYTEAELVELVNNDVFALTSPQNIRELDYYVTSFKSVEEWIIIVAVQLSTKSGKINDIINFLYFLVRAEKDPRKIELVRNMATYEYTFLDAYDLSQPVYQELLSNYNEFKLREFEGRMYDFPEPDQWLQKHYFIQYEISYDDSPYSSLSSQDSDLKTSFLLYIEHRMQNIDEASFGVMEKELIARSYFDYQQQQLYLQMFFDAEALTFAFDILTMDYSSKRNEGSEWMNSMVNLYWSRTYLGSNFVNFLDFLNDDLHDYFAECILFDNQYLYNYPDKNNLVLAEFEFFKETIRSSQRQFGQDYLSYLHRKDEVDVFDATDAYFTGHVPDPDALLSEFELEMDKFNGPELLRYWQLTYYTASEEMLFRLNQHVLINFCSYLHDKQIQEELSFMQTNFLFEVRTNPFILSANASEKVKAAYIEFVREMIMDHPYNGKLHARSILNRANLTITELEHLSTSDWIDIELEARAGSWYEQMYVFSNMAQFRIYLILNDLPHLLPILQEFIAPTYRPAQYVSIERLDELKQAYEEYMRTQSESRVLIIGKGFYLGNLQLSAENILTDIEAVDWIPTIYFNQKPRFTAADFQTLVEQYTDLEFIELVYKVTFQDFEGHLMSALFYIEIYSYFPFYLQKQGQLSQDIVDTLASLIYAPEMPATDASVNAKIKRLFVDFGKYLVNERSSAPILYYVFKDNLPFLSQKHLNHTLQNMDEVVNTGYEERGMLYPLDQAFIDKVYSIQTLSTFEYTGYNSSGNLFTGVHDSSFEVEPYFQPIGQYIDFNPVPNLHHFEGDKSFCHDSDTNRNLCSFTLNDIQLEFPKQNGRVQYSLVDLEVLAKNFQPVNEYVYMGIDVNPVISEGYTEEQNQIKQNNMFCYGSAFKGCLNTGAIHEMQKPSFGYQNCTNINFRNHLSIAINDPKYPDRFDSIENMMANISLYDYFMIDPTGEERQIDLKEFWDSNAGNTGKFSLDDFEYVAAENAYVKHVAETGVTHKFVKNAILIEFEETMSTSNFLWYGPECYCKFSYSQCPLVQFELVNPDPRAWLETPEGPESTLLNIEVSEIANLNLELKAKFMNVMDSPSVNVKVVIREPTDQDLANIQELVHNLTLDCPDYQKLIGQSSDFVHYVAKGQKQADLSSPTTKAAMACIKRYVARVDAVPLTDETSFETLNPSVCHQEECLTIVLNTQQPSEVEFEYVAILKDPVYAENSSKFVLGHGRVQVSLGMRLAMVPSEMGTEFKIFKQSSEATSPKNTIQVHPLRSGGKEASYYVLSATNTEITPVSTLLHFDPTSLTITVESEVLTTSPLQFYIYGRTNPNAENEAFYDFTDIISVDVVCDSAAFKPSDNTPVFFHRIGDPPTSILQTVYSKYFTNENQFCPKVAYELTADYLGSAMSFESGKEIFSFDQVSQAIVVNSTNVTASKLYTFFIKATREDHETAFQRVAYRFVTNETAQPETKAVQIDESMSREIVLEAVDGTMLSVGDINLLTIDLTSAIETVQAEIPLELATVLVQTSDAQKYRLYFKSDHSTTDLAGEYSFQVKVVVARSQPPQYYNYNLKIIIKNNNYSSSQIKKPIDNSALQEELDALLSNADVRAVIRPVQPETVVLMTEAQTKAAIVEWQTEVESLRDPDLHRTVKIREDEAFGVYSSPASRLIVSLPLEVMQPTFVNKIGQRRLYQTRTDLGSYSLNQLDVARTLLDIRLLLKSDIDPEELQYSIILSNWTQRGFGLQLNFTNPLRVSSGQVPDQLLVKFRDSGLFYTKSRQAIANLENFYILQALPKQLPTSADLATLESTASILASIYEGLGLIILPGLIWLKMDITTYIRALQTFQIASVVAVYNFKIPANALVYLEQLQTLGRIEFISVERFRHWLPQAIDDDELLTPLKAGYKTTNFWYNAHAYLLGLAVLFSLKAIFWKTRKQEPSKLDKLKAYWQDFMFRSLVVTFALCVHNMLQMAAGVLAIGAIVLNRQSRDKIYHLYILFVILVPASFVQSTSSKLLAIHIINLAAIKKLFSGNPKNARSQVWMERFNLIFTFSLVYFFLSFTDFLQNPSTQYFMGGVYIAYLSLIAITNFSFLVWTMLGKLEALRRQKTLEEGFKVAHGHRRLSEMRNSLQRIEQRRNSRMLREEFDLNIFIGKDESTITKNDGEDQLSAIPEEPAMEEDDEMASKEHSQKLRNTCLLDEELGTTTNHSGAESKSDSIGIVSPQMLAQPATRQQFSNLSKFRVVGQVGSVKKVVQTTLDESEDTNQVRLSITSYKDIPRRIPAQNNSTQLLPTTGQSQNAMNSRQRQPKTHQTHIKKISQVHFRENPREQVGQQPIEEVSECLELSASVSD